MLRQMLYFAWTATVSSALLTFGNKFVLALISLRTGWREAVNSLLRPTLLRTNSLRFRVWMFFCLTVAYPISVNRSGRAVWGMNCLRPLKRWYHGFESIRDVNIFVHLFCFCVVCRYRIFVWDWSPFQGVMLTIYKNKKLHQLHTPNSGL
jgi:hypothetical protein